MRNTFIRTAAVALALSASATPVAVAQEGGGSWTPPRDMRSPDARDADEGRGSFNSPDVIVVSRDPQRHVQVTSDEGIDWADAGIGGGVIGAIALLASGGVLVARRRSAAAV